MKRVLICGVNWLGDAVMTMPAIQALRKRTPDAHIAILAKPAVAPLWRMHRVVDDVLILDAGGAGMRRAIADVKMGTFDTAFVFPNSFRSALIPFMARVPVRCGLGGHGRAWMLTEVLSDAVSCSDRHQAWEYIYILGLSADDLEPPRLEIGDAVRANAAGLSGAAPGVPLIAMLPGAAYGPAKQWPVDHFAEVGRRLVAENGCRIIVLGSKRESELCSALVHMIGEGAQDLAGRTSLEELAGVLSCCATAVTNDSGGMHLAAAVGTPVVAIYGMTDFKKTGPLGDGHRLIYDPDVRRARDLARDDAEAVSCLHGITPERVLSAVRELLSEGGARA